MFRLAAAVTLLLGTAAHGQQVVVHPKEIDDILANPGMGWETFSQTSAHDKNLPPWIPSTVYYVRWGWNELESQPGKLNTEFLDAELREAHDSGQKLAFRVMCCSTTKGQPYHPEWLKSIGGRELIADYEGITPLPIPDFDDAIVLERHLDFIERLGQLYDGHPDIDHVDLGSVGWWGEWHLFASKNCSMPRPENRKKVVDAYLSAFKKTPLLMLIGAGECLTDAVRRGTGWRADCLGDVGNASRSWSHMRQGYPTWIKESKLLNAWRTAPVAWETGDDLRGWVSEGVPLRYVFNYALACHASYINNKSAPLPAGSEVRSELERFLRRLGYRLALKELKHPANATPGSSVPLIMKWQNTGWAPCYKPYRVAFRLDNDAGDAKVFASDISVNHWLPGSIELFTDAFFKNPKDLPRGPVVAVSDTIHLPDDLPPGQYTVSVAVLDSVSLLPAVRLAIAGRTQDGWYPVSKISIVP